MNTISTEEFERIERFLNGEMPEAEAVAFEQQLSTDKTLQSNTQEIKLLLLGIQEQSLKEQLNSYDVAAGKPTGKLISIRRRLMIAASIIIILGLGTWALLLNNTSSKNIYSRFYKPDPGLATSMGTADNYDFEKAMVEYKNNEYDKAIVAWNSLLKQKPSNDSLQYFIGAAYQANGDDDNAIKHLRPVADNGQSAFNKDACWYLGLSYLRKKENQQAIGYIQRSEHPQKDNILNIINK